MNKNIIIALSIAILVLAGCGQKSVTSDDSALPGVPDAGEAATTGNEQVDNVGKDIADVSQTDNELSDSDLEGLEDTLADIENI